MRIARFVASGCGIGQAPVAPGTVASAAAVAIGAGLLALSPLALLAAALLATAGGFLAVRHGAIEGDPGWVVIDEFAGQWLTMLTLPAPHWPGLFIAFILFRILDVTKLGPVGWADRQRGPFGIMADDVIAGVIGAVILLAVRAAWPDAL